jgi:hypothetical protein
MKARPQRQREGNRNVSTTSAERVARVQKLHEQLEGQLKQMERFVEDVQVNIKQVWKRKDDGLLVKVSGLIFQEPNRVMWRALPDQDNPSAYGTVTETEFKEQFEYQFPKSPTS